MKITHPILLLAVFAPLVGRATNVLIGTNEFQVVFADMTLNEQSRTRIVADLQQEYLSFANSGFTVHNTSEGGYVRFPNVESFPYGNDVDLPREFSREQGETNATIHVAKRLSDKYLAQFALENANTNVFSSARVFIQDLQNGILQTMTSNQVSQFFYYERATPESLPASREKLSHFLDNMNLRQPSVLSIFPTVEAIPSGGEVFVMAIPYADQSNGNRNDAIPAVWVDGQWKLLLWD